MTGRHNASPKFTPAWLYEFTIGACVLLFPALAQGQSFYVSGGTSSLIQASGFQANYRWSPVSGWIGLAAAPNLRFGGFVQTEYKGHGVGLGDQFFPFVMDTDVFERSQYFQVRGLSVSGKSEDQDWTIFFGATARDCSTTFSRSAVTSGLAGAVFYRRKLNPQWTFNSQNIFRRDVTSLQGISFRMNDRWSVSATGGVGANRPYGAAATQYRDSWLDARASYIASDNRFRRISLAAPIFAERTGANFRLAITPLPRFRAQIDSEQLVAPSFDSRPPVRASLDSLNLAGSFLGFAITGSLSESRSGFRESHSRLVSVNRRLGKNVNAFASAVHVSDKLGASQTVYIGTLQERVSRRFSLRETINRSAGRTTMGYGAHFISNRLTLGADYQTVFNPLTLNFAGRHFYQAWMITAAISLPGGIRLHYDNYVDAYGKVRYTAYVSGIGYSRDEGFRSISGQSVPMKFHENIIRGIVRDERGNPLWGIAVRIGTETVFSDHAGRFFVREKDQKEFPITVSTDESVNPGRWEVVAAPQTAVAAPERSAEETTITLRRIVTLERRGASEKKSPESETSQQPQ